ncbi:unnamed protein product, partial [Prorocentrum cordatum]
MTCALVSALLAVECTRAREFTGGARRNHLRPIETPERGQELHEHHVTRGHPVTHSRWGANGRAQWWKRGACEPRLGRRPTGAQSAEFRGGFPRGNEDLESLGPRAQGDRAECEAEGVARDAAAG